MIRKNNHGVFDDNLTATPNFLITQMWEGTALVLMETKLLS